VVAQFIDNDEDGIADDQNLQNLFAATNTALLVGDHSSIHAFINVEAAWIVAGAMSSCLDSQGNMIDAEDGVKTNSCTLPENRGANSSDRSTWEAQYFNRSSCE
jgi:hypothetical protein